MFARFGCAALMTLRRNGVNPRVFDTTGASLLIFEFAVALGVTRSQSLPSGLRAFDADAGTTGVNLKHAATCADGVDTQIGRQRPGLLGQRHRPNGGR